MVAAEVLEGSQLDLRHRHQRRARGEVKVDLALPVLAEVAEELEDCGVLCRFVWPAEAGLRQAAHVA